MPDGLGTLPLGGAERWRPLPQALATLLLGLLLVLLPHLPRLPPWIGLLTLACGAWCWLTQTDRWAEPNRWLRWLLAVAATAGVFLQYGTVLGREAGTALLALMLALKLLEMRELRDGMVVVFLAYFLLAAQFFHSQSIAIALYAALAVSAMTAALVMLNQRTASTSWWAPLRLAVSLLGQAVPFMLALFVLFPRIPGPLWTLPEDAHARSTGLSERMEPGSISHLSRSDAVAFRARFRDPLPAAEQRYWRGPVLWDFDGRAWTPGSLRALAEAEEAPVWLGQRVRYQVTLEPHQQRWLFALDLPSTIPSGVFRFSDQHLEQPKPVSERLRYEAASYLSYRLGTRIDALEKRRGMHLPLSGNPVARALAAQLRLSSRSDTEIVQAVLARFRGEPYVYTLDPPLLGADSVDDFLFRTRRGFCEHFASAFVFVMRAAGLPARVVTGYQGGELNPLTQDLIVRQSDAHAWAEVWLRGQGWVRVDPTAAVAPQRIETGIEAAIPAGEPLPFLRRSEARWLRQLRFGWDAANSAWNQWVLGYGPERQASVLDRLGLGDLPHPAYAGVVLGVAALLMLSAGAWIVLRRRTRADPAARAYARFCNKLARAGLTRRPGEGSMAFADRAATARPELGAQIRLIAMLYDRLRYGRPPPAHWQRRLEKMVLRFKA